MQFVLVHYYAMFFDSCQVYLVRVSLWHNRDMSLLRFIADLESRFDQERRDVDEQDIADLVVEERAAISLVQRLLAHIDQPIAVAVRGGVRVSGTLREATQTWILIADDRGETLIPLAALAEVSTLGRAVPTSDRVLARLSIASVLRRLAQEHIMLVIDHDAGSLNGVVEAVYSDHVDVRASRTAGVDARDAAVHSVCSIPFGSLQKISVTTQGW